MRWRNPGVTGVLLVLLATPLHADDIRRWVDADGTVHFADKSAAPRDSEPVQLGPGSVVKMEPAPARGPFSDVSPPPSRPRASARPCTPVMREYVDPKTGMHSERDTGRCEEDDDVLASDDYPFYYWGPCHGPGCIRPPHPPLPPHPPEPAPAPAPRIGPSGAPLIPYR